MAKILLIDDDKELRRVLRMILENDGHTVDDVGEGKTAIRMFHDVTYDLIVTDVFMPAKDGFEIIEEIRSDFPTAKFIVISGGGVGGFAHFTQRLVHEMGITKFLTKPFRPDDLIAAVNDLLPPSNPS